MIWLQFKIINKILRTRALPYKMSITDNPLCSFCNQESEDLQHLFFECDQVLQLWNTLYNWTLPELEIGSYQSSYLLFLDKPTHIEMLSRLIQ